MKPFAIIGGVVLSIVFTVFAVTCTGKAPHTNLAAPTSTGSPMVGTPASLTPSETSGNLPLRSMRDIPLSGGATRFHYQSFDSNSGVRLAQGKFTTNLLIGRVNYNFPESYSPALMQINSAARVSAVNLRLRYIYRPNTDFFVIYNQTSGTGLERPSYSLQFKLTRDFTF